jgi:tetratricopeptide (TPR) repeat protein
MSDDERERPHGSDRRGRGGGRATSRLDLATRALLVAITLGSVLALGAVHVPVLLVVATLAAGAAALAAALRATSRGATPWPWPAALAAALAAYSALQAVPLPVDWLRVVAPQNADVWQRALDLAGETRSFVPLSLDPGASVVEVTRWLTYGGVFAAAAVVASRRGSAWGVSVVFLCALAAGVTTLAHGLVGATKVFGLYEPAFRVVPWHVGPLLNANNLAGYLNLGAFAGIGLMLMRRPMVPVWIAGAGVALIVGVEIVAASRGGVLALPVGLAVLAVTLRRRPGQRADDGLSGRVKWVVAGVVASGVAFAVLGATGQVWHELYDKNAEKIEMIGWAAPLVRDHAWLGVGRGAFESAFPAYRFAPGHVSYTHIENFPAQWAAEWGLPVAAAALAGFAWAFRPGPLGVGRSTLATAAWTGVLVVLLQNLFDLALEVPAVDVALALVLGSLWGDVDRRRLLPRAADGERAALRLPMRGALVGVAVVATASLAATALVGRRDLAADRERLRSLVTSRNPPTSAVLRAELLAAMLRHPAEPYFPLLGALDAWRERDRSPMPWLQRTLERSPMNGRAHLLLAEVLAASGALKQALFELRLAQEADPSVVAAAGERAVKWTRDFDELATIAPDGRAGGATFDELAVQLGRAGEPALRGRFDAAAIARDPALFGPRVRLATDLLAQLAESDGASCGGAEACAKALEAHARALEAARPGTSAGAQLRARLELARGEVEQAEARLREACRGAIDTVECLMLRARIAADLPGDERLRAVDKELRATACSDPRACADANTLIGDLHAKRGELRAAVASYEKAAASEPTEARLLKLAHAASGAGEHVRAAETLQKVVQKRGGADAALEARIAQERDAALRDLVRP